MESKFVSDFFAGNRQRLRELFTGTAPIILTANGQLQRSADTTYKFTQDATFWYLTGIDDPGVVLVMEKDREYLIVPALSEVTQLFDGKIEADRLSQISGIDTVYEQNEGWAQLETRLNKVKHIATLAVPPAYIEQLDFYTNPARAELIKKIKQTKSELEILDISQHIGRLRMVKQPIEIAAIQKAIDITAKTLKPLTKQKKLAKFKYEYEIEAELNKGFRLGGGSGHAFDPIVACGSNACTIHYVANNDQLTAGDFIIIDVGAEYDHYAADITRTVIIGQPNRRQQAVYDAAEEVQNYAFSLLKPGVLMREYEEKIEKYMGEKLRELNLIKTITHEDVRKYFPHATSHFLGLNAHDAGDYNHPLEPGVVLAVEPGIYIPEEGIGVRIEDNVVIGQKSLKILTKKMPKGI